MHNRIKASVQIKQTRYAIIMYLALIGVVVCSEVATFLFLFAS